VGWLGDCGQRSHTFSLLLDELLKEGDGKQLVGFGERVSSVAVDDGVAYAALMKFDSCLVQGACCD